MPDINIRQHEILGLARQNGKVRLERYALGQTANARWTSWSVAKSVTQLLVGAAIKDGYISSIDAQVTAYIPQLRGTAYDGVTVRQMLTMTSGVAWNENYTDPNSDIVRATTMPAISATPSSHIWSASPT